MVVCSEDVTRGAGLLCCCGPDRRSFSYASTCSDGRIDLAGWGTEYGQLTITTAEQCGNDVKDVEVVVISMRM